MMIVKIKRQDKFDSESYWQSFHYDGPTHVTVSAIIDSLNNTDELFDTNGKPAAKIRWECSCMQSMCGGCAMVINGVPALACATFADQVKGKMLILEPLSKFPVVSDLIVDRSIIYDNLIKANAYLESFGGDNYKEHNHQYSVAKCLKCGLCLEVCPNYRFGQDFFGAILANDSYLIASQSAVKNKNIIKEYKTHFGAGCSNALSCKNVCPMEIDTITSILKMNRK